MKWNPLAAGSLAPDREGHYSALARAADRESLKRLAVGQHPMDRVAAQMAGGGTRRRVFSRSAQGIGALALGSLIGSGDAQGAALAGLPHFPAKAKRVIYLHLVGAPPQMETF